jgi:hypothetical protein
MTGITTQRSIVRNATHCGDFSRSTSLGSIYRMTYSGLLSTCHTCKGAMRAEINRFPRPTVAAGRVLRPGRQGSANSHMRGTRPARAFLAAALRGAATDRPRVRPASGRPSEPTGGPWRAGDPVRQARTPSHTSCTSTSSGTSSVSASARSMSSAFSTPTCCRNGAPAMRAASRRAQSSNCSTVERGSRVMGNRGASALSQMFSSMRPAPDAYCARSRRSGGYRLYSSFVG